MNPLNTQITEWGLDEPLRFPDSTTGWELLPPPGPMHLTERNEGRNKYSLVISPRTAQETLQAVSLLIDAFQPEFDVASAAIQADGWRQLYHRGTYVLECLTAPRFHADQELRRICEQHELFDDPPAVWLGTTYQLPDLAINTCYALRQAGPDVARAAWAILSAAQSIPLTKAEILNCRWFAPQYIKELAKHFN